jgi:hypothetical protein
VSILALVRFEVFTAVTMKNGVFWDVTPCALVRTDVSEEPSASFIRVTRIGELGTTQAATAVIVGMFCKYEGDSEEFRLLGCYAVWLL